MLLYLLINAHRVEFAAIQESVEVTKLLTMLVIIPLQVIILLQFSTNRICGFENSFVAHVYVGIHSACLCGLKWASQARHFGPGLKYYFKPGLKKLT